MCIHKSPTIARLEGDWSLHTLNISIRLNTQEFNGTSKNIYLDCWIPVTDYHVWYICNVSLMDVPVHCSEEIYNALRIFAFVIIASWSNYSDGYFNHSSRRWRNWWYWTHWLSGKDEFRTVMTWRHIYLGSEDRTGKNFGTQCSKIRRGCFLMQGAACQNGTLPVC